MNSSFLYHVWGLYSHKCSREEYKGNTIILHIETKERQKTCPLCGHTHLVKNGYRIRDFVGLPIGSKKTIIRMKVQRYKCMNSQCTYDRQERIHWTGVDCIGIDEFAVKKGRIYKTIVVNLRTGRIIYVDDGKDADSLDRFWKKVRKKGLEN